MELKAKMRRKLERGEIESCGGIFERNILGGVGLVAVYVFNISRSNSVVISNFR